MRGSPPPELSNNPFLEHPSNALTRFPDLDGFTSPADSEFTSWIGRPNEVSQQQRRNANNSQPARHQHTPSLEILPTYQVQGSGLAYPQQPGGGSRFQPSSLFGQHLSNTMNTGGLGNLQGGGYFEQPQPYGMTNGGPFQVPPPAYQPTSEPVNLSEFDPYAAIGRGSWNGGPQTQQLTQPQRPQSGGVTKGSTLKSQRDPHPRELVPKYKAGLEAWEDYSWKQLMNSLESLKSAWEKRMKELDEGVKVIVRNPGVVAQNELAQFKDMLKEADASFSNVAASIFQLKEVLSGYRHSRDDASKRRVREAVNSALRELPEYPYDP